MNAYYLAIDIGASSGRHILAHMQDGKLQLEEIHRFTNGMHVRDGSLCWDAETLFGEIKQGLKKCKEIGKIPVSVGIDTWGVDFVLLDQDDNIIGDAVGYRDDRTKEMDIEVNKHIAPDALYQRTGIQKQIFNTIYQLMSIKVKQPHDLELATTMLLIPDYFNYCLTGIKATEYTNATTTQLVSPHSKDWDYDLIDTLNYPKRLFAEIKKPGSVLGSVTKEVAEEIGFTCQVVLPATHDTGSAVVAVPSSQEHTLYISSGTWSLMGVERQLADCSMHSHNLNLTNEGGYEYRFRYLKNIMGLWMIQSVRKEIGSAYSFGDICQMAEKEQITSILDCNAECFLAPDSMVDAVQTYCEATHQEVPQTLGEIACVIYHSLAECYAKTVQQLEEITACHYATVHVVGGGANAAYLNQLTANATEKTVLAGPTEATAIGNITVQMITDGAIENLQEARTIVRASFEMQQYEPRRVKG
ncbi:MAG: rhamnulokinase [Lachnospiraceae bacterium]